MGHRRHSLIQGTDNQSSMLALFLTTFRRLLGLARA
jgi:hypothetical protein